MHWTVGKVKITKIVELATTGGSRFILPQAGPQDVQKLPRLADGVRRAAPRSLRLNFAAPCSMKQASQQDRNGSDTR
jgi:hypothetical protein